MTASQGSNVSTDRTANSQYDRFRSFAERYLVARAEHFEVGKELEQGWQCIMDAKKLYQMMARASNGAEQEPVTSQGPVPQVSIQAPAHGPAMDTPFRHTHGHRIHEPEQLQGALLHAADLTRNGIPQPASLKALINRLLKGSMAG